MSISCDYCGKQIAVRFELEGLEGYFCSDTCLQSREVELLSYGRAAYQMGIDYEEFKDFADKVKRGEPLTFSDFVFRKDQR